MGTAIISALVGALAGYGFAMYHARREVAARRGELLKALRHEIEPILLEDREYTPTEISILYHVHAPSLDLLLDGETLNYRSSPELVRALLNLRMAIAQLNDFVDVSNLQLARSGLAGTRSHRQLYDLERRFRSQFLVAREAALACIPVKVT